MGMVCCVAKVHDSVQDDLKHDEFEVPREVQNSIRDSMSLQPAEVDLEDRTRQEDISRQVTEDDLKDDSNMDVTQELDYLEDDAEGKNDIGHPDGFKPDEITDDISQKLEDDIEDKIKDDRVQDIIPLQKLDGEILSSKDDGKDNYTINLINLPTELLVKIMFYLPIHDRMMICDTFLRDFGI